MLADFIRTFVDLNEKNVLELGAGCGLAGIVAAKCYGTRSVFLTDVNADVLQQLAENIALNFDESRHVTSGELDWADYDLATLPAQPNVILAAGMEPTPFDVISIHYTLFRCRL